MKGGTVQILWHGKDPVLSVDFHLSTGLLATAGADRDIKLWSLHRTDKSKDLPTATFKANLSYHGAAVNVLRFSPSGAQSMRAFSNVVRSRSFPRYWRAACFRWRQYVHNFPSCFLRRISSGVIFAKTFDGELLIWRVTQADQEIPSWKVWKTLRFHLKDVLDLGWSPDGAFLMSGSVDNTSIIWNVEKGTAEQVLADHQHYVQGVTWDPAGKYVASLSGDRTCRIYSLRSPTKRSKAKDKTGKYACQHILCKKDASAAVPATTPTMDGVEALQKQVPPSKQYLFYDENMPSFFRRLCWSPEGSFLLIPAGIEKQSPDAAAYSLSYIVSRNDLSRPAIELPAAGKPVVAARFCPVLYSLSPNKTWKHDTNVPGVGAFKLPYRLIFAVATLNSVFIYDTEQSCPIAVFAGVHYAPITDLAWSFDAKFLAVSSQDGYCTLVGFDEGDLGTPLPLTDIASLVPDYRLASAQVDSSVVSPPKDASGNPVDLALSEPAELPRKMAGPEKGTSKHAKIRRVKPKPISEYLQKLSSSQSDSSTPTGASGRLDDKEVPLTEVREGKSNAEAPLTVLQGPEGRSDLGGCRVDRGKRLDGVDTTAGLSSSGSEQTTTPAGEAIGKEASKMWESCSKANEASPDIFRKADWQKTVDVSSTDQQCTTEYALGPNTPLCEDHALSLGGNPCLSKKPRDQYADIYVRPLKFRRISPKVISDDIEKPAILKPISSETSLPLPSGLQELQPT